MGYFQPGGVGTTIYIYDDNDAAGGHAAGSPHNCVELNAFAATNFSVMQSAAGLTTQANRVYLASVNIIVGGQTGVHGFNQTTWTETESKFIFTTSGIRITIRAQGSVPHVDINWGTAFGSGEARSGHAGVSYFQFGGAGIGWTQDLKLYGCRFECTSGSISFTDSAQNNAIELANVQVHMPQNGTFSLGSSGVLGKAYNVFLSTNKNVGTNVCGSIDLLDSNHVVIGSTGTNLYGISSGSSLRKLRGVLWAGTQSVADVQLGFGTAWFLIKNKFSSTTTPFSTSIGSIDPEGSSATKVVSEVHFRVHDHLGDSVSGIPCTITSTGRDYNTVSGYDVWEGWLLTNGEGDLSWTEVNSTTTNGLIARSYGTDSLFNIINADRSFNMIVNDTGSPNYNANYSTETVYFSLCGRDMKVGSVSADYGDYYPIQTIPVKIFDRTALQPWVECEAP